MENPPVHEHNARRYSANSGERKKEMLTGSGSVIAILPLHVLYSLAPELELLGPEPDAILLSHSSMSPVLTHFGSESGLSLSRCSVRRILTRWSFGGAEDNRYLWKGGMVGSVSDVAIDTDLYV